MKARYIHILMTKVLLPAFLLALCFVHPSNHAFAAEDGKTCHPVEGNPALVGFHSPFVHAKLRPLKNNYFPELEELEDVNPEADGLARSFHSPDPDFSGWISADAASVSSSEPFLDRLRSRAPPVFSL